MKLLVPLDGSEASKAIVPAAAGLMRMVPGLEVHALTVLNPRKVHGRLKTPINEPVDSTSGVPGTTGTGTRRAQPAYAEDRGGALDRAQQDAIDWMRNTVSPHMETASVTYHIAWDDKAVDAILQTADELDVDAIAMATHGRTGVSHMLAGSVTEGVVRKSTRPVLVMGPQHQPRAGGEELSEWSVT